MFFSFTLATYEGMNDGTLPSAKINTITNEKKGKREKKIKKGKEENEEKQVKANNNTNIQKKHILPTSINTLFTYVFIYLFIKQTETSHGSQNKLV